MITGFIVMIMFAVLLEHVCSVDSCPENRIHYVMLVFAVLLEFPCYMHTFSENHIHYVMILLAVLLDQPRGFKRTWPLRTPLKKC